METIKSFKIKRLLLMLRKDVFENLKYVLIGYGSVVGLLFLLLLTSSKHEVSESLVEFYITGLFITGIFISGMAFTDLRVKEKTMNFLTLPATLFEKFLSMFLLTSIGFVISYTLVFYIFNGLAILLSSSVFNTELSFLNINNNDILTGLIGYLYVQSMFLAGAATFKRAPLFLTMLAIFVVFILIASAAAGLSYFLYSDAISSSGAGLSVELGNVGSNNPILKYIYEIIKYSFLPIFWLVTYFKLKEKEV